MSNWYRCCRGRLATPSAGHLRIGRPQKRSEQTGTLLEQTEQVRESEAQHGGEREVQPH